MKLTPIDAKTEIEGAELSYRGNTLIVARSNNVNFKKVFRQNLKPYKQDFEKDRMDDAIAEDLMIQCVAETILVGWKKFTDIDGKEWKYSVANAKSLLFDDKDVYNAITEFSEDMDNYITETQSNLTEK